MVSNDADFKWLIDARRNIQLDLLDLHTMAEMHPALLHGQHLAVFSTLVSAAFSLWRAAFLSDIERERRDVFDAATRLLNELLTTNAIPFSTDRKLQNWMFGYYVQSAVERLASAKEMLGSVNADFTQLDRVRRHGLFDIDDSPQELWSGLRDALAALVGALEQRVEPDSTR